MLFLTVVFVGGVACVPFCPTSSFFKASQFISGSQATNSCYLLSTATFSSYSAAQSHCAGFSANLVAIASQEENVHIFNSLLVPGK
jgi:hypothetical protein